MIEECRLRHVKDRFIRNYQHVDRVALRSLMTGLSSWRWGRPRSELLYYLLVAIANANNGRYEVCKSVLSATSHGLWANFHN